MLEESISQNLVRRATEAGKIPLPYLQLCKRVEKKVNGEVEMNDKGNPKMIVVGTGTHKVKLLGEKSVKGKDYKTQIERSEVEYTLQVGEQKKRYSVPVLNENGELHYFVQRMADVAVGEDIILEYQSKGKTGFINIERVVNQEAGIKSQNEIPIIEEDEEPKPKARKVVPIKEGKSKDAEDVFKDGVPGTDTEEEINVNDIPF